MPTKDIKTPAEMPETTAEDELHERADEEARIRREELEGKPLPATQRGMNFSVALAHLKGGQRVYRHGWNGKGMFVFMIPGTTVAPDQNPMVGLTGPDVSVTFLPQISMRTAQGQFVPWVASHTDLFAEDWLMVPSGRLVTPPREMMQ